MRKLITTIKRKWNDPVWANVFAAAIVGLLSSIGIFLWSLIKQVPFEIMLKDSIKYLKGNYIQINFLTLAIILFLSLVLFIPLIRLKIITFHLRHLNVPASLNSKEFNVTHFLNGTWICEYTRPSDNWGGVERIDIANGNNYINDKGKLIFILTDMKIEDSNVKISWNKTLVSNGVKHSRETLRIQSNSELTGTDDNGLTINYRRPQT